MRRYRQWFLALLLMFAGLAFPQKAPHFYNVDKEIQVEGKIQEIIMEPRYKTSAPFLIVFLEERNSKKKYLIELSPVWFFKHNFHKGENLVVVGSLYTSGEDTQNIIAREVRFRGETLILRDKNGFPNWRGGQMMKRKGRRKGKGP
jgi:hypothetical protein